MRRWLVGFGAALLLLLGNGCASYQLGDPAEPRVPAVRGPLQRDLSEAFLTSGQVVLTTSDRSATMQVVLTDWGQRERTTRSDDTGRAFSVDLVLQAEVTLVSATGEVLLAAVPVRAETTIFADNSLMDAQFQAMPQLTTELAERIATLVTQPWE